MNTMKQESLLVDGPAGGIEVYVDQLEAAQTQRGVALIAHPHPLFGGTADNKVVTTLARALRELGYVTLRPNFRGVGASSGSHDNGIGESEDMLALHAYAQSRCAAVPASPIVLAGYSFGAYVMALVARRLVALDDPAQRLILVGTATGEVTGARSYDTGTVAADSLLIHGDLDETVPLANVLAWARPQELPVVVVPGADHFFHRKLHILRNIVHASWPR